MDYDRLPRWLLSSWVANPRPVGATNYTYGKGMHAALTRRRRKRVEWRAMLKDLNTRHKEQQRQQQQQRQRQQQQQQQQQQALACAAAIRALGGVVPQRPPQQELSAASCLMY